MIGILLYITIFLITMVWIGGWTGLSMIIGAFFNIPMKTASLIGATLGPLGFLITILVGFLEKRDKPRLTMERSQIGSAGMLGNQVPSWDPFS